MRTLLLISIALVVAACSDNSQSTSPRSIGSTTTGASARDRAPNTEGGINTPFAKPTGPVAFTQIAMYKSQTVQIIPGATGNMVVSCPAGSFPTGAGHHITLMNYGPHPIVMVSEPIFTNGVPTGWNVQASNAVVGAVLAEGYAWVVCAS